MPISKEKLAQIISGPAKELCDQHARETMSQKRRQPQMMTEEEYFNDELYYDSIDGADGYQDFQQNGDFQISQQRIDNSRVPDYIKESMINNPIDVSALDNTSVLGSLEKAIKQNKKKVIKEQKVQQPTVQQECGGSVDYSIIKAIFNDCLNNFFKENSFLSNIQLKGGNIYITDNKGDTYAAKLVKINK